MLATGSPFEVVGDVFAAKIGAYSVLQLTVGVVAVAAVVGGVRWAFGKALGNR